MPSSLKMVKNILVIEDDGGIRQYLKELLTENNYSVRLAPDGTTGLLEVEKILPDLVLLDLGLPDITGEAILEKITKDHPDLPIIILTAKDNTQSVVHSLSIGASDYITKPFEPGILLARIQARLREKGSTFRKLKMGDLELDPKTAQVTRGKKQIKLTPQEFKLLEYLMSNKDQVLSREVILARVWLYNTNVETRVVDVYMGYLRKKIDKGFTKKLIQSVRGFGYMIKS